MLSDSKPSSLLLLDKESVSDLLEPNSPERREFLGDTVCSSDECTVAGATVTGSEGVEPHKLSSSSS